MSHAAGRKTAAVGVSQKVTDRATSAPIRYPLSATTYLHALPRVAIRARHGGQVAEVDRVRELLLRDLEHRRPGLGLAQEVVADVAVLGDHLAVLRHVLVVVAAEAAFEIEVADVVGVRAPVDLHLR